MPLELDRYSDALSQRALETEPVSAFADRLAAQRGEGFGAFDLGDGVSMGEGEAVALFFNAELRRARAEAGVALATFEHAGLWRDPVLGFDAARVLSGSASDEFAGVLSFSIPLSGRLDVEKDRAGAAHAQAIAEVIDAEWAMRARVRGAWARWSVATEKVGLLEEILRGIERVERLTDVLGEAGQISRVEAQALGLELATRRTELLDVRYQAQRARADLLHLMGLSHESDLELLPSLTAVDVSRSEDDAARLIASNTTLDIRRHAYRVSEESLRLEIREQFPDLEFGAGYGNEDDDRLLLGVSVPVPVLNGNRRAIAEARAQREVARIDAEMTFERLLRDLVVARAAQERATAQLQRLSGELVPIVDEQVRDLENLVALGEMNAPLLLDAVTRSFEVKARLLDLRLDEVLAGVRIWELLGPDRALTPVPVTGEEEDS